MCKLPVTVKINNKDMKTEYGLTLASRTINAPEPKTNYLEVPYRNGSIDLTEALGPVRYNDRTISLEFVYVGTNHSDKITKVYSAIHGQKVKVIFGDDSSFYYSGRCSCSMAEETPNMFRIGVEITADPFKYDVTSSAVDWEWDGFDLEEGIINDLGQITVSGETTVTMICRRDMEIPEFTVTGSVTMTYKGVVYTLSAGKQKLYRVFFEKGNNVLKFSGSGTVSIDYVGGSL